MKMNKIFAAVALTAATTLVSANAFAELTYVNNTSADIKLYMSGKYARTLTHKTENTSNTTTLTTLDLIGDLTKCSSIKSCVVTYNRADNNTQIASVTIKGAIPPAAYITSSQVSPGYQATVNGTAVGSVTPTTNIISSTIQITGA